jgi:hypothetical protein
MAPAILACLRRLTADHAVGAVDRIAWMAGLGLAVIEWC